MLNFLDTFAKYYQMSIFMKIHPVENELFHEDSQVDKMTEVHDEVNSRFS